MRYPQHMPAVVHREVMREALEPTGPLAAVADVASQQVPLCTLLLFDVGREVLGLPGPLAAAADVASQQVPLCTLYCLMWAVFFSVCCVCCVLCDV
jgi:hypothetical protein